LFTDFLHFDEANLGFGPSAPVRQPYLWQYFPPLIDERASYDFWALPQVGVQNITPGTTGTTVERLRWTRLLPSSFSAGAARLAALLPSLSLHGRIHRILLLTPPSPLLHTTEELLCSLLHFR
jgi:hypothetical protein